MSNKPTHNSGPYYRLNYQIQAPEIRVLDEEGKQLGLMTVAEAIEKAKQAGLDLVEVAPKAKPPVCKVIDFKKFQYIETKRLKGATKKSKQGELKEVRVTPFIATGDLENRLNKAITFLKHKHQVKITVRFKGRQMGKRDFGNKLMDYFVENLAEYAKIHQEPKFAGRQLSMIVIPDEKKKSKQTKNKEVAEKKV